MPKRSIKLLWVAVLAITCILCLAGCTSLNDLIGGGDNTAETPVEGEENQGSENQGNKEEEEEEAQSVIKSLVAKSETVVARVDENKSLPSFYTLTGFKSLSAAQKKCTYTSSDTSVVKITNTMFKALKPGTAVITVTSNVDKTKTCSFTVVVKDVFFDRSLSKVSADDNVDQELIEDGAVLTTADNIQGEYIIKGVQATKLYVSVDIVFTSASASELYPKCGIVFSTTSNTTPSDNKVYFFLNSEIGNSGNSSWTDFGVCEVQNGGNWAWNPGVTDANARHKNAMYQSPELVTYGTKFNLAVARDGFDFHVWVNGVYAGSMTTLMDLFGTADDTGLVPALSHAGFFQFNSVVTFSNYSISDDAAEVDAKIASIAEKTYVSAWDQDAS